MDRCWIFWVSLQKWQWHVMMLGIVGAYFVLFLCVTDISLTRENLKATPNKETRNKSRPLIKSHNIIQRYHQGKLVLQVILLAFASIYLKQRCQSTWTHLKVFEAHYMWIGTKYNYLIMRCECECVAIFYGCCTFFNATCILVMTPRIFMYMRVMQKVNERSLHFCFVTRPTVSSKSLKKDHEHIGVK